MKAKEVMEKYKITRNTLSNWVKKGLIGVKLTPSGRYIYIENNENNEKCSNCSIEKGKIIRTIPLSSVTSEEDIIRLNHYTNLQPLCSYINRYIKKDLISLEQCFF